MGEAPIIEPPSKCRQSCHPASKKPLKRGSATSDCGGLDLTSHLRETTRGATLLLYPASKLGPKYTTEPYKGSTEAPATAPLPCCNRTSATTPIAPSR